MTSTQRNRAFTVLALFVLALAVLAPTFLKDSVPEKWPFHPIRLGLDLKGGTYFILGVQSEEAVKSQLRTIASSLLADLRKEKVGVLRARVVDARKIEVQTINEAALPAVEDYVSRSFRELKRVGSSGSSLVFEISDMRVEEIKKNAVDQAVETIRNRVDQFGVAEPTIQRSGEERIMLQLPDISDAERVKKTIGSVAQLEFRLVADSIDAANATRVRSRDGEMLPLQDEILMTGDAVSKATVEISPQSNETAVSLRLTSLGAKTFDRITSENIGRRLAIVLDGVVQSAPTIRSRISGGDAQITGNFSAQEAHTLAIVLRSGALPAPLTFEEERTIGASLGADSIASGVKASFLGTLVVVIFIIFYYKKAGMLAVGCLCLNMLFLLALLSMLGATLTLPGIAGLALTVAIAIDANVVIYERIREELRAGVSTNIAAMSGYDKALWTILDANITTFITGLVLYVFGTGPIKGFAVTLCLGICTSVFSALFMSKLGFEVLKLKTADGKISI